MRRLLIGCGARSAAVDTICLSHSASPTVTGLGTATLVTAPEAVGDGQ